MGIRKRKERSGQKGFEGWYFKHQKGDQLLAFIPGTAESGAFIQLLAQEGARQFEVSNLTVKDGIIRADRCRFSLSKRGEMIFDLQSGHAVYEYVPRLMR